MQIHLRNEIDLDGQREVIDQTHPVDVTEKNGFSYFIFVNEEKERVVIKCNDQELIMTRFSNPKSVLRFHREVQALVTIPTPMGIQHFMTKPVNLFLIKQITLSSLTMFLNIQIQNHRIFSQNIN